MFILIYIINVSNALTIRRDKSIIFSRIVIKTFLLASLLAYTSNNVILSSSLTVSISVITLLLLLFIYIPEEWFDIVSILTFALFTR